jgi:hypothetical protein
MQAPSHARTTHAPTPPRDHCLAPTRTAAAATGGGKYRRLFPDLEPLDSEEELLLTIGRSGGLCDGSPLAERGGDDATGPAGWPFFGQLVAHDITADRSPLQSHADVEGLRNVRSPRANLECVYAEGPSGSPFLYDRDDPARLLLGINDRDRAEDVPRNPQGIALIGDPRNDVHLFIAQLHVALLKTHNRFVGRLRAARVPEDRIFDEARRATTWHYQWVILRDFLPRLVGPALADELLTVGPRFYAPDGVPFIPFEFADAAYRYGHSQIRHSYRVNERCPPLPLFPDLIGFGPVPDERVIDWSYLFDLPGRPARQPAKRIDGRLANALIELPAAITGHVDVDAYHSLAARDLQRGQAIRLPSGEAVARRLGVEPLSSDEVGLREIGWEHDTPLWYYILREADVGADGERLGPVGGRIVGEVLVGIVDRDPESFRAVDPGWRPDLPSAAADFAIGDLLAFASTA